MAERQPVSEQQPFGILYAEMGNAERRASAKLDQICAKIERHEKAITRLRHKAAQAGQTLESIRMSKDHFQEMMER